MLLAGDMSDGDDEDENDDNNDINDEDNYNVQLTQNAIKSCPILHKFFILISHEVFNLKSKFVFTDQIKKRHY